MDSEIELNDVIQELHVVSTRPDLFPILLESNFVGQLLCLLGHENIGKIYLKNNRFLKLIDDFKFMITFKI